MIQIWDNVKYFLNSNIVIYFIKGQFRKIAAIIPANRGTLITHNVGEFSREEGVLIKDWTIKYSV